MSGGKGEEDPTWTLLFLIAVFIGIGWVIWYFFKTEIFQGLRYVRLAELQFFGLFDDQLRACAAWARIAPIGKETLPTQEVFKEAMGCFGPGLQKLPRDMALQYYNITSASLGFITEKMMPYLRGMSIPLLLAMGIIIVFFTRHTKFKVRHSLETFIKFQAKMWPVISPIVQFKPAEHSARVPGQTVPDQLPLFAEALSPEEWLSFHRVPVANGIPDRDAVRRAFLLQLGPRWQGLENLPFYMLALFAAFSLKGVQKRDESDDLLGRLSVCWSLEKGFCPTKEIEAEIRKIVFDPAIGGEGLRIANQHAYRTTALLGVLKWARFMGGVLAPAHFLWLRAVDRPLWYALNNLGRRAFHSEGAGAIAHFMAESAAKKPLPIPRIDTAIVTMNQYLAATGVAIPPRQGPGFFRKIS